MSVRCSREIRGQLLGLSPYIAIGNFANDGAQSHCGSHASNTRDYTLDDVITRLLLVTRKFCTGWCARIFDSETSCCIVSGIGTCSRTGLLWYRVVYHRTVDSTAVRNVILCTVS